MVGFVKLSFSQVANLNIGTQVFVKMVGNGWQDYEKEFEGLYHVGAGQKLWSEDCDNFFFIYEMNTCGFEFEVYMPDIKYKMNTIIKDVKDLMRIYQVSLDDIFDKIRKGCNVS